MCGTKSNIQQFFNGLVVFVTGGTGLLGNILVEKLLRSCPDIKKIYVLVRAKWGKDVQKRFEELINTPIYDDLKKRNPDVLKKLFPLAGDLGSSRLGLNDDDLQTIIEEVNCIFHAGATVKFTEELRRAVMININGTNELIGIARKVKNLKAFIQVSTMYSFCTRDVVDEQMYEFPENGENLIELMNIFDDEKLNKMAPTIIGKWPNTYTYSKAATEDLLQRTATDLPIAIVRPAIVAPAYKEPLPGWTTNEHSISLFMIVYNLGVAHVMNVSRNCVVDAVPADYVVNNIIAAAWSVGTSWKNSKSMKIYNCISSQQNPITWGEYNKFARKHDRELPSKKKTWHRFVIMSSNKIIISFFFWLKLPFAYMSDIYSLIVGKPQNAVKMYKKVHYFLDVVQFFSRRQWSFSNKNNQQLWNNLEESDKELFNFDFGTINWDEMFYNSTIGFRQFIFKELVDTLPQARIKRKKLKIIHYLTILIYSLVVFYLFLIIFKLFMEML